MAQFRLMPIGVFAAVLAGSCTVGARNLQDLIKEVGEPVVAGRLTVTPIMFHPEDHRAVEAERGHLRFRPIFPIRQRLQIDHIARANWNAKFRQGGLQTVRKLGIAKLRQFDHGVSVVVANLRFLVMPA